ncbi:MAG: thymidine phosphorylase family protein [Sinimarinibacterium sp.]|jgi:thymidine phosphorylase
MSIDHDLHAAGLMPVRMGIDAHHEAVVFMRRDCPVCRSEGFEGHSRVQIHVGERFVIAQLFVVDGDLVAPGAVGLSEAAWSELAPASGELARFSHPPALASMSAVRRKIYGSTLTDAEIDAIVADISARRYSNVELAAFVAASGGERMSQAEIAALTRAMVRTGRRLEWPAPVVVDKHCVGGLPGNRTTPIVVAIVAANGLLIPKTSSRAITSPAGTADTMETLAPVDLSLDQLRRVVESEGGCVVWGGAVALSPADDVLIRIERALDIDSEGQLIASVLSKKAAAGSTHVVIDIPVGPTAKVRSQDAADQLASGLNAAARAVGLHLSVLISDGMQPVGRGIGPALEARDVVKVLKLSPDAPRDLRERAVLIAGAVLEMAGRAVQGQGVALARATLDDGRAWHKFAAICQAQGGLREPPTAAVREPVLAQINGRIAGVDCRRLARAAKLAGAPAAPAAGMELHVRVGDRIEKGQPLFTLHAQTRGELHYALDYLRQGPPLHAVEELSR